MLLASYTSAGTPMPLVRICIAFAIALTLAGCYMVRPSSGGGQVSPPAVRVVQPADVALPAGYRIEAVATGLTFPTGVAFDASGRPYVVESGYSYGEVFTTPRLLRVEADGRTSVVATGARNGPWTGVVFHDGNFYVAEGGETEGGRILRIAPEGHITSLVSGLPSIGDHHTNGPAIGADGMLYFGQGTATNSGVVGNDNAQFGWLKRHPDFHDIPCRDIALAGRNFEAAHWNGSGTIVSTGAYLPYGTPSTAGQVIPGKLPCSGAVMRVPLTGGAPELVAWGFRNPFGLAVAPDGQLYVAENSYDDRGSRPVWGSADVLWRVKPGAWYGWPDYAEGFALTRPDFKPPGKAPVQALLQTPPEMPPRPVARFPVHSSADGFDFSRNPAFGNVGEAFVAEFGDQAPTTGKVLGPVGFKVVRVNVDNGVVEDFAVNRSPNNGPASKLGTGGLERPVAVRFDPEGRALYVVDFGVLSQLPDAKPEKGTGVLWRIVRQGAS
jgi:glucose/arabinose dehydrogenase